MSSADVKYSIIFSFQRILKLNLEQIHQLALLIVPTCFEMRTYFEEIAFLPILLLLDLARMFIYVKTKKQKSLVFWCPWDRLWLLNVLKWGEIRSHGDKVNPNWPKLFHLLEHETQGYPSSRMAYFFSRKEVRKSVQNWTCFVCDPFPWNVWLTLEWRP